MKKHTDGKRVHWTGFTDETPFNAGDFTEENLSEKSDSLFGLNTDIGRLTVVDRMTGFGWRDIETGFTDTDGKFWLASGGQDVRDSGCETMGDAIQWIKERANTCTGV